MPAFAKVGPHVARVLLGLMFLVPGLNFFLNFLPPPPAMPDKAMTFLGGLMASGYVMPLVKVIEIAAGVALLSNRFVPLALTLLAPIIVNIVAIHVLLASPAGMALVILALEVYLAWSWRAAFAPMLRPTPASGVAAALPPDPATRSSRAPAV